MFLRSSKAGGRTYWRVVESYREGGKPKHRTIRNLGPHETREAAESHWRYLESHEKYEAVQGRRKAEREARSQWIKDHPKEHRREQRERAKLRKAAEAFADAARPTVDPADARRPGESFADYASRMLNTGAEPSDCFATLGLSTGATVGQVKAAYRTLATQHHPDRGGDPAAMARINEAYGKAMTMLDRLRPVRA